MLGCWVPGCLDTLVPHITVGLLYGTVRYIRRDTYCADEAISDSTTVPYPVRTVRKYGNRQAAVAAVDRHMTARL